jgi:flotillin
MMSSYKKVGPNQVLIVTGAFLGKKPRVVKGSGAFVVPIVQDYQKLALDTFQLMVDVKNANTQTQVPLNVNANAVLRVGSDASMIATAAEKILGLEADDRDQQLSEIVRGQIRSILGQMLPENASNNYAEFQEKVISSAQPLMTNLGLEIVSLQITDVNDDNDYIKSLYAKDVADKNAAAKEAQAQADFRARKAQAEQDQLAQQAEQEAARKVAEQKKNTAIVEAEYKAEQDTKQAAADQAYNLSKAEASKAVIDAEGNADALKQEKDAQVAAKSVEVEKQRLQAEVIAKQQADAEATRLNADANRYAREQQAEAEKFAAEQKATADATIVRQAGQATADANKAKGEAEAAASKATGLAGAEVIRETGLADADAIKAKGLAQAEAQEKLSRALEQNGQLVIAQMIVENLPQIAAELAKPLGAIDSMTVFNGTEGVVDGATQGLAQTMDFVNKATGLDLKQMMEQKAAGTVTLEGNPISK